MKNSFTFLFAITLFLMGCSSSQNASKDKMHIVDATYSQWSEPPAGQTEIPERGTDLSVTVQNWPQDYSPLYIVYNGSRSGAATVSNRQDTTVNITGRIIHTSSKIVEPSKSLDVSDRLVFENSDGDTTFIEIKSWSNN